MTDEVQSAISTYVSRLHGYSHVKPLEARIGPKLKSRFAAMVPKLLSAVDDSPLRMMDGKIAHDGLCCRRGTRGGRFISCCLSLGLQVSWGSSALRLKALEDNVFAA
eukprot:scaffold15954_cov141-Skeletonema_dohrnii-CCMP3373.AAC.3